MIALVALSAAGLTIERQKDRLLSVASGLSLSCTVGYGISTGSPFWDLAKTDVPDLIRMDDIHF